MLYAQGKSVEHLLQEVQKLNPDERAQFLIKLDALNDERVIDESPEALAAIDEGLRSLREEGSIPIEQVIEEVKTWRIKSP